MCRSRTKAGTSCVWSRSANYLTQHMTGMWGHNSSVLSDSTTGHATIYGCQSVENRPGYRHYVRIHEDFCGGCLYLYVLSVNSGYAATWNSSFWKHAHSVWFPTGFQLYTFETFVTACWSYFSIYRIYMQFITSYKSLFNDSVKVCDNG